VNVIPPRRDADLEDQTRCLKVLFVDVRERGAERL